MVTFTATPLDLTAQLANAKVGAVLHVGQPSVTIVGVGELLFGKTSPAGRMVQTAYPAYDARADEISIFDFNMRPGPSIFPRPDCAAPYTGCKMGTNSGRAYRFYSGKAVVPFGSGLSYTTFSYSATEASGAQRVSVSLAPVREILGATHAAGRTFVSSQALADAAPLVQHEVTVTNTGSVDSDRVVLGFLVLPGAGQNGVPLQILFGFERVPVPAGQSVTTCLPRARRLCAHAAQRHQAGRRRQVDRVLRHRRNGGARPGLDRAQAGDVRMSRRNGGAQLVQREVAWPRPKWYTSISVVPSSSS